MKLVTFDHSGRAGIGTLHADGIVDLAAAAPELPRDMTALLGAGREAWVRAAAADGPRIDPQDVVLRAPITRPPKVLAVGLNYADHIAETGRDAPTIPLIFNKQPTSVIGPGADIHRPRVSDLLDYEGELAVVVGRRCRHVAREDAAAVIAGYTVANDVSVRDWQRRSPTMTMGKSFDTHCPLGPAIVSADEVDGPSGLALRTWVNDEIRQQSNTRHLVFDAFDLVEHLSTAFTLEPGDVILTGTPGGVAAYMEPPGWLVPGDRVRVEIEGLGSLENPVVQEPDDTALA